MYTEVHVYPNFEIVERHSVEQQRIDKINEHVAEMDALGWSLVSTNWMQNESRMALFWRR